MKLTTSLVLAAYWAIGAVAIPTLPQLGPLEIFHDLPKLPPSWTVHGPADKDTKVKAQIGLKQNNIKELQAKLLDISNPESSSYGNWLSQEEGKSPRLTIQHSSIKLTVYSRCLHGPPC